MSNNALENIIGTVDLIEANGLLEDFMMNEGKRQYLKNVENSNKFGYASSKGGRKAMSIVVEELSQAINEQLTSKKAGRKQTSVKHLRGLDRRVLAYVTLRTVLDSIHRPVTLASLARNVAESIISEVNIKKFSENYKSMFIKMTEDMNKRRQNQHQRTYAFKHTFSKDNIELDWLSYESNKEAREIGLFLVMILIESIGIVEVTRRKTKRNAKAVQYVTPTDTLMQFLKEYDDTASLNNPKLLPTIIPPKPWSSMFSGGYHTNAIKQQKLVKVHNPEYLKTLDSSDLSQVYDAVNNIQDTAWTVNKEVLTALKHIYENGYGVAGVPDNKLQELPEVVTPNKPYDEWSEQERKDVSKQRRHHLKVQQQRAATMSKINDLERTIKVADMYSNFNEFWYPHNLDFRGRVYPIPSTTQMNPQGCDYGSSLLKFSNGEPLDSDGAVMWFKVQGANTWGEDKVTLQERCTWVDEQSDFICKIGEDPISNMEWVEADKPFAFLAWAIEYAQWVNDPDNFISHIPVAMDGSNNGLQHLSAMLRDEVGGKSVNLVPTGKVEDVYKEVADEILNTINEYIEDGVNTDVAKAWIDFGINRKTTKRVVMVVPYGGTVSSAKEYVMQYITDSIADGKEDIFESRGIQHFEAVMFLVPILWDAIGKVVVKGREAMAWMQKLARQVSKYNAPLVWELPTGFKVHQEYKDLKQAKIKTTVNGSVTSFYILKDLKSVKASRQASAISPNVVHSLDAAALMMTVNEAVSNMIYDFAMIHDSYGTHARHAPKLARILRYSFIELYGKFDILEYLYDKYSVLNVDGHVEVLPPPEKGELRLSGIADNEYFFA